MLRQQLRTVHKKKAKEAALCASQGVAIDFPTRARRIDILGAAWNALVLPTAR
jgi:hypothetical protein